MRYVLDSSVALKWVLAEPDSAKAVQLRNDFLNGVHELLAPDVFPIEVGHALAKAERRNIIKPPQGAQHLTDVLNTLPQIFPSLLLLPRAFAVASNARIGVYDCIYVALAEREKCQLVTADDRLLKNLGGQFPFIVSLTSVP
jgi:predicted nucleic acid-binding protein